MEVETAVKATADAASGTLARFGKLEGVILAGVDALPALIEVRLQAEGYLRRSEAAAAIGERVPALEKTKKLATDTAAALHDASIRLDGFRSVRNELGGDLAQCHEQLDAEILRSEKVAVAEFRKEWTQAIAAFSAVLGKRDALEAILGRSMDLPAPLPAPVTAAEVGPLGELNDKRGGVAQAIASLAEVDAATRMPENARYGLPGSSPPYFDRDPDTVYLIVANLGFVWRGYTAGYLSKCVVSSFDPGILEFLAQAGDARRFAEVVTLPGMTAALLKKKELDERELAEKERAHHRRAIHKGGATSAEPPTSLRENTDAARRYRTE